MCVFCQSRLVSNACGISWQSLFAPERWDELASAFAPPSVKSSGMPLQPMLSTALQAGIRVLKTPYVLVDCFRSVCMFVRVILFHARIYLSDCRHSACSTSDAQRRLPRLLARRTAAGPGVPLRTAHQFVARVPRHGHADERRQPADGAAQRLCVQQ